MGGAPVVYPCDHEERCRAVQATSPVSGLSNSTRHINKTWGKVAENVPKPSNHTRAPSPCTNLKNPPPRLLSYPFTAYVLPMETIGYSHLNAARGILVPVSVARVVVVKRRLPSLPEFHHSSGQALRMVRPPKCIQRNIGCH